MQLPSAEVLAVLHAIERGEVTVTPQQPLTGAGNVEYLASNGWRLVVFDDCLVWDYLDHAIASDGREWDYDDCAGPIDPMYRYRASDEVAQRCYGFPPPEEN